MESRDTSCSGGIELARLAWIAGIIEGEGTITTNGNGQWMLAVQMTDEDVIQRLLAWSTIGLVHGPYRSGEKKPYWRWNVARRGDLEWFLPLLRPWMLGRRRARLEECLASMSTVVRILRLRQEQRDAVVADWQATGSTQWDLARRHGISRSRVQQLLAASVGAAAQEIPTPVPPVGSGTGR